MQSSPSAQPPWLAVALLSASALAYEILLTRLFAVIQWHHLAHMIISLALLGYGMSGTFLALAGKPTPRRFPPLFSANAAFFALGCIGCTALAQTIPFNPLELAWDRSQLLRLLAIYLLLALPFFAVANALGLALISFRHVVHRVYAADLVGAGLGALGVVLGLFVLSAEQCLAVVAAGALAAAALAGGGQRRRLPTAVLTAASATTLLGVFWTPVWLAPTPSPYKGLAQALQVVGAEEIAKEHGPLGVVTAVANEQIPIRYAPGMSLATDATPPEQIGLFVDGDSIGALTRFDGNPLALRFLDQLPNALAYHLVASRHHRAPRVLVLGAGGGTYVLQAIFHRAQPVEAVELNDDVVDLVRERFAEFSGHLYDRPQTVVHVAEARGFATTHKGHYDVIQAAPLGGSDAAAAGLHALNQSYLYTVQGIEQLLQRVAPGGYLSLTSWVRQPPRETLKLFATAIDAQRALGIADPGTRMILIRGWTTATLVVKRGRLCLVEIEAARSFAKRRAFDLAWYPGMDIAEANRYNILDRPYLFEGARALLGPGAERYLRGYKFELDPATDDRPYFFHFWRWRTLPELLGLRAGAGLAQLEWGYLVLLATLLQACLASVVLILLPLRLARREPSAPHAPVAVRYRVLVYFFAVGLAFLFIEIAFIQRFLLFLHHPLYAVAVVLAGFLFFAGLGSAWAQRWHARVVSGGRARSPMWPVVAVIGGFAGAYTLWLPVLFDAFLGAPDVVKVGLCLLLIAPLAFAMGVPFPSGLVALRGAATGLIPWAWAINGCASVISAALAALMTMEIGFSGVVLCAIGLYGVAALSFPSAADHANPGRRAAASRAGTA